MATKKNETRLTRAVAAHQTAAGTEAEARDLARRAAERLAKAREAYGAAPAPNLAHDVSIAKVEQEHAESVLAARAEDLAKASSELDAARAEEEAARSAEAYESKLAALRTAASLDTFKAAAVPCALRILEHETSIRREFDALLAQWRASNAAAAELRAEGIDCPDLESLHVLGTIAIVAGGGWPEVAPGDLRSDVVQADFRTGQAREKVLFGKTDHTDATTAREALAIRLEARSYNEAEVAARELERLRGSCACGAAPLVAAAGEAIVCSSCGRELPSLAAATMHDADPRKVAVGGAEALDRVRSAIERAANKSIEVPPPPARAGVAQTTDRSIGVFGRLSGALRRFLGGDNTPPAPSPMPPAGALGDAPAPTSGDA